MRWLPLVAVPVLAPFSSVTSAAPAPAETKTVRGVVRDREKRPLAGVQVSCDTTKRGFRVETGDDGAFEFEGVPIGQFRLKASLLGVPGEGSKPDVDRSTSTSASSFDLTVDRGEEVVFRAAGVTYASRGWPKQPVPFEIFGGERESALWIETETGSTWARWHAIPQGGALAFRRVERHRPWFLYVGATEKTGTGFRSGQRLPTGEVAVELEAGLPITGTVRPLPPTAPSRGGGPSPDFVVARRGPVTVWASLSRHDGRFSFPRLPSGAWRVTAVCGGLEGTIEAPAGAVLDLELR